MYRKRRFAMGVYETCIENDCREFWQLLRPLYHLRYQLYQKKYHNCQKKYHNCQLVYQKNFVLVIRQFWQEI
jgi:hypothetical protein